MQTQQVIVAIAVMLASLVALFVADRGLANVLESIAIRLLTQARAMRKRHDAIQGAQAVRLREELN